MTAPKRRRNNAPVRPRRPATGIPDILFALGSTLLTMATAFFIASFVHEDLSNGDVGTDLARIFAGCLLLSALLIFLMGLLLLRSDRSQLDHYLVPIAVGIAAGAVESWFFLEPRSPLLLLLPFILYVFVLRSVRRGLAGLFDRQARR